MKKKYIFLLLLILQACNGTLKTAKWSNEEIAIISSDTPYYVLTINNDKDTSILRAKAFNISEAELISPYYDELCKKLVATVTDPSQDGVGIAGPQVGLSRRVVAVQRLDKEGEPFEVYPNIRIVAMRGEMSDGSEGCLSVPDMRGVVARFTDIDITYSLVRNNTVRDTTETIQGFTAVIFQHECDHLDGVLYIDKIKP